jgi:uncharacterized protein YndB with AHSA1/START domain
MFRPFVIERTFPVPVSRVWKALTDPGEMKQWYFDIPRFRAEVGFAFQFSAGSAEKQYLHLCQVTAVIPDRQLAYSWRYQDHQGLSVVTFELFPRDGHTRLRLTHSGLESFGGLPDFTPESFAQGWQYIIGTSLAGFLDPGTAG